MATINNNIRTKFQTARTELSAAFIERDVEIDVLLLALCSGEHACLLGPAGTGKSELLRKLATILDVKGEDYFEIVFNKFTTPEQFLGPYSYTAMQKDKYERNTANRLPRAKMVFADEIWKCVAAVNCLLPVMCEGTFENGGVINKIPLKMVVSASNEMPEDESLGAMWDRYMLRHWVKPIQSKQNRRELFSRAAASGDRRKGAVGDVAIRISESEWDQMLEDVATIELSKDVASSLLAFREQLERDGIEHGDRRWVKAVRVLQAKAYLAGDDEIDEEHFTALVPVMWNERDHVEKIETAAKTAINPLVAECREYHNAARTEAQRLIDTGRSDEMFRAPTVFKNAGEKIRSRREATSGKAAKRIDAVLEAMATEFEAMKATIKSAHESKFDAETL